MASINTARPDAETPRVTNHTGGSAGGGATLRAPAAVPAAPPSAPSAQAAQAAPAPTAPAQPAPAPATAAPPAGPSLAPFRAGRSDADRAADLLAFAIAAERGLPPTPEGVARARQEADAALGEHAIRYLHNNVEQIRQEAVAAHLGRFRQPPGFGRLVAACLVAQVIGGGLAFWLWTRPDLLAALAGLLGS